MKKKGGKKKMLWGVLYAAAFAASFAVSAVVKLSYNPLSEKYKVQWGDSVGTMQTDFAYGEGAANKFDLYLPAAQQESYGLIVYIHAGGFTSGDKKDDAGILQWLCSKGYVAAGVNYTLFNEEEPTANVYTMSQEIKASIPAVVEQAAALGYPIDRMAVAGGSAGGTLALLYAYRDADTAPAPVRMVFEMVGPPSFYPEDWTTYGLDQSAEAAAGLFSAMSGREITPEMIGTPAYDEAVRDISPFMWVDGESVPTLCAYGVHDRVCPFGSVRHLVDALEANGVPHDYIEFPHSGHGLQNDDKLYEQYMDTLELYLETYMQ